MLIANPAANPFRLYANNSGEAYLEALIRSIEHPLVDGVAFPTFPPAEFQRNIHGHSGEHSLREAFNYACVCRRNVEKLHGGFRPDNSLLDFGAGWGRIARMFLPYFDLDRLVGYEPNERVCRIAREHNRYIAFVEGSANPPTIFRDETYDFVTAWSVFSHLPQHIAKAWLAEFARITKPGGLLFLTTWGEKFLDRLEADAAKVSRGETIHEYVLNVLSRAGDLAQRRTAFNAGDFVWIHQHEHYGDTLIPPEAMATLLPEGLKIAAIDTEQCPQTVFVLQKT